MNVWVYIKTPEGFPEQLRVVIKPPVWLVDMYFTDAFVAEDYGGFGMVEWDEGDLENIDDVMAQKGTPENYTPPPI